MAYPGKDSLGNPAGRDKNGKDSKGKDPAAKDNTAKDKRESAAKDPASRSRLSDERRRDRRSPGTTRPEDALSPDDPQDTDAPDTAEARDEPKSAGGLYFFPEQEVSEARVRQILAHGPDEERAWVISHLLRYAQWSDIWTYVSREEVREIFPVLDLPETLRTAWGRMLKVEAPVA